jgi:hypothetical protein
MAVNVLSQSKISFAGILQNLLQKLMICIPIIAVIRVFVNVFRKEIIRTIDIFCKNHPFDV